MISERDTSLDARLIRALQRDGRATIQQLAAELDAPRSLVSDRLRALTGGGTVRVLAAYDPAFVGQTVIAHLSIAIDRAARPVARALAGIEEAVLVSCVGGLHDIVLEVRVDSNEALGAALHRVRSTPGVTEVRTQRYTGILKGLFIPRYDGVSGTDAIDRHLVELLQRDGRASYTSLARAVSLSAPAVRARVQRLLATGIVTISAVETRGALGRQLSMGLGITLGADSSDVLRALQEDPAIEFAAECIGSFDVVATIAAATSSDLLGRLDTLRALPGVLRLTAWQHLELVKEDYYRQMA
ncbi:Lrp/AsnC family transcriptional regulator [Zhihengliuella halotolerans]|uniref:DNA-binding Lrp family transcriptional regulator n=1 Tax=Zhihengliuella halotolerans TaxID=370736 RepID=A0A4Q8AEK9_9MICC|nr:Lrp/AsnC family transcriptional regulator [Zhihengliuella halotolerans]RZU62145.1 DNA-binding Lrp family transcriptional regulator [Zhihengliuella halotolerans]